MAVMPADLCAADPTYWAVYHKIRLQSGEFSLTGRSYQWELMNLWCRRACFMKATQVGGTLLDMLVDLHGMIYGRYPQGVLYLLPTSDAVQEFGKAKFSPLIQENREAIGQFVASGAKGTDSASIKKIGGAFLYLRGARLSQERSIAGVKAKESVQLRNISVDKVHLDELDLMDDEVIAKAEGRMGASRVQELRMTSNPTIPGLGIGAQYDLSDQRHWFRRCGCGTWMCAELTFPACVKTREDGTGYIGCPKCGSALSVDGEKGTRAWVPAVPANTEFMRGYQLSQLSSEFHDPADILRAFNDPPQGNLEDVYRLRLGIPWVSAEDQLRPSDVYACCGQDVMQDRSSTACAMGVDIGKTFHVWILRRTGRQRFETVKLCRLPIETGWSDLYDLARRFNVRSAVIDIRPYEDGARKFQKSQSYRVMLCEYTENALTGNAVDDKRKIIKAYRTGLCDTTHRLIAEQQLVIPRRCPEVDEAVSQVCAIAKVLETDKKSGVSVYRYIGSSNDHYRHALGYAWLAAQRLGVSSKTSGSGPNHTVNEYDILRC